MSGNPRRPGAHRSSSQKRPAEKREGRRALKGRGPTPRAKDRVGHPAQARAESWRKASRRLSVRDRSKEAVAGRNSVLEALRAGVPAEGLRIFSRIEADDRVREILALAVASRIEVREATKPDLDTLSNGATHQGIVLLARPYPYYDLEEVLNDSGPSLVAALDGIQDPRNLGAIVRSAAAFGATGVVIPERRAASMTAAAWKASAGAASRVPIARVTNLAKSIASLKDRGCFVIGLDASGETPLADCPLLNEPLVVAVGSEGKGLSRLVREACDQVVSIPISRTTESLNASVAASVTLYEVRRAREAKGRTQGF